MHAEFFYFESNSDGINLFRLRKDKDLPNYERYSSEISEDQIGPLLNRGKYPMEEIVLNTKVARAIAQILRDRWTGTPLSNTVCHAFSDIVMAATVEKTAADLALKKRIFAATDLFTSDKNALVDVDVCKGIVELRGIIPNERTRHSICNAISSVEGVSYVHDHLIHIDGASGTFLLSEEDAECDCNTQIPVH